MWITNGSIADVAVVWANTTDEPGGRGIRGFVVPTDTPGFAAHEISHKMSLRASVTAELTLDRVRLPADAVFPDVTGLKGPLACLSEARYGIVWGALGAARSSLDAARRYSMERIQFGRPIAGFQLTQAKLANDVDRAAARAAARAAPRAPQGHRGPAPGAGLGRQVQQHHQGHRDLPHGPHDPRRQRGERGVPGACGTPTTSSRC
jgi:alkylation response protein AidB-like acyl-CoA dehydrogenase